MELSYNSWDQTQDLAKPAEKLILLHGMGGTGSLWRPVAASLENEMKIIAPDQRGHGKSRVPHTPGGRSEPSYTPSDYGRDLIDTMEKAEFHPSWVLGHSMGVRTAVAAAFLKPEWVKGLILVDLGFSGVAGGGLGENLAQFLRKLPHQFSNREEAREFMKENCPDPSIAQYLMAVSVKTAEEKIIFPFDHSALIQTIEAARDTSVRKWLKELAEKSMPALVLRGQESKVWSQELYEQEKEFFQNFSSIQFQEVPNSGHGLPFEQRAEFVKRVREFIRKNPPQQDSSQS